MKFNVTVDRWNTIKVHETDESNLAETIVYWTPLLVPGNGMITVERTE
jgi:hypothetical protein